MIENVVESWFGHGATAGTSVESAWTGLAVIVLGEDKERFGKLVEHLELGKQFRIGVSIERR